jgi:hypothetical protein
LDFDRPGAVARGVRQWSVTHACMITRPRPAV